MAGGTNRAFRGLIFLASGGRLEEVVELPNRLKRAVLKLVHEESSMTLPLSAAEVLNREFLEIRAKILEIAGAFDRLERAAGDVEDDPRVKRLHEALKVLGQPRTGRAEQVQLVFSRPYDEAWQRSLKVLPR